MPRRVDSTRSADTLNRRASWTIYHAIERNIVNGGLKIPIYLTAIVDADVAMRLTLLPETTYEKESAFVVSRCAISAGMGTAQKAQSTLKIRPQDVGNGNTNNTVRGSGGHTDGTIKAATDGSLTLSIGSERTGRSHQAKNYITDASKKGMERPYAVGPAILNP